MKSRSTQRPLKLAIAFCAALSCSGCHASLNASNDRLHVALDKLLAGSLVTETRSSESNYNGIPSRSISFSNARGIIRATITSSKCRFYLSQEDFKNSYGQPRNVSLPYENPDRVRQKYEGAIKQILGVTNLDSSIVLVTHDRYESGNQYVLGETSIRFRMKVNGFGFVDRLWGATLRVEQLKGLVLSYSDSVDRPNVAEPQVSISESSAKQKAASDLHVTPDKLRYDGLGYAADGNALARVCYGYTYAFHGNETQPSWMATIYIRADNGDVLYKRS